ncbi:MAG: CheR family methyltransferase [Longimicrobiales bacterium]
MPRERKDDRAGDVAAVPYQSLLPLAGGKLSDRDAAELHTLKQAIFDRFGLDCKAYKEPCLRRRLAVRMRARGLHSYADYRALIEQDATEGDRLLDAITINVSKFYRNPEIWQALRTRVLPRLFKRISRVRIWSAGCAGGEEPYTMAMLLLQYATEHGQSSALRRFDILGTDVDRRVLEQAARAEYGAFSFSEIAPDVRRRYFEDSRLREEVKRLVHFQELDLMAGPFPRRQHLILCRNVIIYFQREMQERLFHEFHRALEPEGVLVLGKVETIFGAAASLFRPISSRERIFCRA